MSKSEHFGIHKGKFKCYKIQVFITFVIVCIGLYTENVQIMAEANVSQHNNNNNNDNNNNNNNSKNDNLYLKSLSFITINISSVELARTLSLMFKEI